MLEGIEALVVLAKFGTVTEAATRLRLTQSAVSKRIQALQNDVGYPLTEAAGRRIRLTPEGEQFLERARPLLAQLEELKKPLESSRLPRFSLALADSIASSWGPEAVARSLRPGDFAIRLHAHRSVLLVESIRLGRYHMGVCTEMPATDLVSLPLGEEGFDLLDFREPARPARRAALAPRPLITIESSSATWRGIQSQFEKEPSLAKLERIPVESFSAAVQMARAGFGQALVPAGLSRALGVSERHRKRWPRLRRRIVLLTRKSLQGVNGFESFRARLVAEIGALNL